MEVVHLNQKQLATRWCISEATLERWRSAGVGPKFLKFCGRVLYRQIDIEAYEEGESGKSRARRGHFSLSTTKARQAARRHNPGTLSGASRPARLSPGTPMQTDRFIIGKATSLEPAIPTMQARLAALDFRVGARAWLKPVAAACRAHIRDRDCPRLFSNSKGASRRAARQRWSAACGTTMTTLPRGPARLMHV